MLVLATSRPVVRSSGWHDGRHGVFPSIPSAMQRVHTNSCWYFAIFLIHSRTKMRHESLTSRLKHIPKLYWISPMYLYILYIYKYLWCICWMWRSLASHWSRMSKADNQKQKNTNSILTFSSKRHKQLLPSRVPWWCSLVEGDRAIQHLNNVCQFKRNQAEIDVGVDRMASRMTNG